MSAPIPVLMVHWNQPDLCITSAKSFLQQDCQCRVVIVDNASCAEAYCRLQESLRQYSGIEVVRLESNMGFAGALAFAVSRILPDCRAPVVIFAAHDATARPGAVQRLIDAVYSDDNVGIAFSRSEIAYIGSWHPILGPRWRRVPESELQSYEVLYGTWFPGHCLAVRREVLDQGIGMDAQLFTYHEEVDMCLHVRRVGLNSVLATRAFVDNTSWSGTTIQTRLIPYLFARNSVIISRKYRGAAASWFRGAYVMLGAFKGLPASWGRAPQFSAIARIRGTIDALRGRYGMPPEDIFKIYT